MNQGFYWEDITNTQISQAQLSRIDTEERDKSTVEPQKVSSSAILFTLLRADRLSKRIKYCQELYGI